jgi:hypothetical protein
VTDIEDQQYVVSDMYKAREAQSTVSGATVQKEFGYGFG